MHLSSFTWIKGKNNKKENENKMKIKRRENKEKIYIFFYCLVKKINRKKENVIIYKRQFYQFILYD